MKVNAKITVKSENPPDITINISCSISDGTTGTATPSSDGKRYKQTTQPFPSHNDMHLLIQKLAEAQGINYTLTQKCDKYLRGLVACIEERDELRERVKNLEAAIWERDAKILGLEFRNMASSSEKLEEWAKIEAQIFLDRLAGMLSSYTSSCPAIKGLLMNFLLLSQAEAKRSFEIKMPPPTPNLSLEAQAAQLLDELENIKPVPQNLLRPYTQLVELLRALSNETKLP